MTLQSKKNADDLLARVAQDFEALGFAGDFFMFTLEAPRLKDRELSPGQAPEPPDPADPDREKDDPKKHGIPGAASVLAADAPGAGEGGAGAFPVELPATLPILPVDSLVVFPHMIAPLTLEREEHMRLVDEALKGDRLIGVFTRKEPAGSNTPDRFEDLYPQGCVAVILRMLRMPDGSMRLLVHGITRARIAQPAQERPWLRARVEPLRDKEPESGDVEVAALRKSALSQLQKIIEISSLSEELGVAANNVAEPGKLADLIASNIQIKPAELMEILATTDVKQRLKRVLFYLSRELQVLEIGSRIQSQVKTEIDRNQRQYVLREQLKAIRQELGEEEPHARELRELRERLAAKAMPAAVRAVAQNELERLDAIQPASPEYGVIRTYLEWFFDLPWEESTRDNIDIPQAARVLDEDHFGLEKVKERILEFLAVVRLRESLKGPILCFVGPPGVGKTSLGRSIARAMGRRFARFSLGGMRDEAEIRGHRRTYIGAMPGRIIKALKDCGSNNPLLMLDEIDKLGMDFRGDPASALLEVLDPEQNFTFTDHYLDVPFDLSKVMFITTANQLEPVPAPLRDRMEIIEIGGYTQREKAAIARDYLIPRELLANGLRKSELRFLPAATLAIIQEYTREAGVRSLQREIATICRKTARRVAEALGPPAAAPEPQAPPPAAPPHLKEKEPAGGKEEPKPAGALPPLPPPRAEVPQPGEFFGKPRVPAGKPRIAPLTITPENVREFLGPPKAYTEVAQRMGQAGVAIGMAWTPTGGDILFIEASRHTGSGKLILTGSLGEVMKESAQAALTFLRAHSADVPVEESVFAQQDFHVHVPAGAVPKDGPSAGTAIAVALASLLRGQPVRDYLSMTGEITLRGNILPVGGIKEKCLAAQRAGIRRILLPRLNRDDYEELPEEVKRKVKFHFVDSIEELFHLAFEPTKGATTPSPGKAKRTARARTPPRRPRAIRGKKDGRK